MVSEYHADMKPDRYNYRIPTSSTPSGISVSLLPSRRALMVELIAGGVFAGPIRV